MWAPSRVKTGCLLCLALYVAILTHKIKLWYEFSDDAYGL